MKPYTAAAQQRGLHAQRNGKPAAASQRRHSIASQARGRFDERAKFAPFSAAPGPIAAARVAFAAFAGRCCDWPHVRAGWCENKRRFHFTCAHVLREEALSFFSLQGEVECCYLTHTQSLAPASGCLLLIICYCCSNVGGGNFMSPVCICAHNR